MPDTGPTDAPGAAAALLSTRITDLPGIRHPVLAGGLQWLTDAG